MMLNITTQWRKSRRKAEKDRESLSTLFGNGDMVNTGITKIPIDVPYNYRASISDVDSRNIVNK